MSEQQPRPDSVPPRVANTPPVARPTVVYAGPATGQYTPTQDERTMAMLIWILGLVSGWIGPLILWLVKREQSRFIDFHGKQALFMHVAIVVVVIFTMIVVMIPFLGCIAMIFVFPLWMLVGIGSLILHILAAMKANGGEWYRVPLVGQWV